MPKSGPLSVKTAAIAFSLFMGALIVTSLWYYRDDVFQTIYDPSEPFQTYSPPPAPNYAQATSWIARPDTNIDTINITGGDIFVVAPTIYLGGKHWNAPLDHPRVQSSFENIVLPNYVMPYAASGRIYAPKYRQAALYTFLTSRGDARKAQDFAYRDIKRSFEVFLSENPPERPIILVGHGQGALHVQRLLSDYFQGSLSEKLAVAYVIDHPLPLSFFDGQYKNLHPCLNKKDTNCIVAFGAFEPKEKVRIRKFIGKNMVWENGKFTSINGRDLLCTNPLLWTVSDNYAPAKLHLGGVAAEGLGDDAMPAPSAKQTGAQCVDGILALDKPKQKSLRRPSRFGGKYRTKPSNIFYEDLRVDAQRRMQRLLDIGVLPKRAPLMEMETIEIQESPVTLPSKQ